MMMSSTELQNKKSPGNKCINEKLWGLREENSFFRTVFY